MGAFCVQRTYTVGELFPGIGGIGLGFERAGFQVAWQVEIDPWCRRILDRHFPSAGRFQDVRDTGAHNLASALISTSIATIWRDLLNYLTGLQAALEDGSVRQRVMPGTRAHLEMAGLDPRNPRAHLERSKYRVLDAVCAIGLGILAFTSGADIVVIGAITLGDMTAGVSVFYGIMGYFNCM
jgi:hypothetical protein